MKRSVSLNQILNGNPIFKRTKLNGSKVKGISKDPETVDLVELPEQVDLDNVQTNKPKIIPVGDNVSNVSVKTFLMRKPPKFNRQTKTEIKSSKTSRYKKDVVPLDDLEDTADEGDHLKMQEVINLENEHFEKLINPKKLIQPISNVKKTNLKELLVNMRNNNRNTATNTYEDEYTTKPFRRCNSVSKLDHLLPPLPHTPLTEPFESFNNITSNNNDIELKQLHKKNSGVISYQYQFEPQEYESLKSRINKQAESHKIQTSIRNGTHATLWTQLFQPHNIAEILLDTRLKKSVNEWIINAFEKLKKPTTRYSLFKSQKNRKSLEPGTILFDGFIIPDDMVEEQEEENELEEFVPLMILHGDGIGKTILINTIMNSLNGQVLDINSSQDRSKKELLDTLSEYCTSHYVKVKKSYGIILFNDVDVLFKEHDKQFWVMVETLLLKSRKPIILLCKDINFIPTNLIELCEDSKSIFEAKKVSTKSVLAFLTEYMKTLGLEIPKDILLVIIRSNQKDIRKCLLQLQYLFAYNNSLAVNHKSLQYKIRLPELQSISDYSEIYDLISFADILDTNTRTKSLIPKEIDSTLMTSENILILDRIEDEQMRLRNDYLIDYRLHIMNNLRNPLMPFEVNVGQYMHYQLKEYEGKCPNSSRTLKDINKKSIHYLSSRIPDYNLSTVRRTRNSRKLIEILDKFQGKSNYKRPEDDDNSVEFDFFTTTNKNLAREINPYVVHLAKSDLSSKKYNQKQFKELSKYIPESEHRDLAHDLLTRGIFKTVWFYANPQEVIDCWSLNTPEH
ncbi:hypothetical protein RI543_000315 [Arxiozyma heterogenica]|uniref:ATPase AAA-type core domain-containing protein n=1 Tax=Arxiozyma heterogenica TaxID=278026 RepID=A0AAN7WPE2_9SACH|nr:hypothetical protein RI543_000315 [Kazachstania heterogenica]